eukprot:PhF_6_TR8304/c2_g1_i1/m.12828
MATSVLLKVACILLIAFCGLSSASECTGLTQSACTALATCTYRAVSNTCYLKVNDHYVWVKANDVYYSQLTLKSGWTISETSTDTNIFHGPELEIVNNVKGPKAASATVPAGPALG